MGDTGDRGEKRADFRTYSHCADCACRIDHNRACPKRLCRRRCRQAGQIDFRRRRGLTPPRRVEPRQSSAPPAAAPAAPATPCARMAGTWSWFIGGDVIINAGGSATQPRTGLTATWRCTGSQVVLVWSYGFTRSRCSPGRRTAPVSPAAIRWVWVSPGHARAISQPVDDVTRVAFVRRGCWRAPRRKDRGWPKRPDPTPAA